MLSSWPQENRCSTRILRGLGGATDAWPGPSMMRLPGPTNPFYQTLFPFLESEKELA